MNATDNNSRRTRLQRYEQAFRALCENSIADYAAGIDYETPEFLRANRAAHDAARGVSWWRQELIERRVVRELDYWKHTGGTG